MLIAQITDLHIGFDRDNPDEFNSRRLVAVLDELKRLDPRPDLLLVTGDIAEEGDDRVSYARYRDMMADLPFPAWPLMGNHDSREPFLEIFPETPSADGFIQYVVDDPRLRIIVLDTLEVGRHGGGFCETRAAWLRARLEEAPDKPTLVVLHHPPFDNGIPWLTETPDAPWVAQLRAVVEGRTNIVGYIAGHIHRPIVTTWGGAALAVCPSTSPQAAIDFRPIDPEHPDMRALIVAEPPAYALHRWDGRQFVSHFATVADHPVLASYTPKLQPLIRMVTREKQPGG